MDWQTVAIALAMGTNAVPVSAQASDAFAGIPNVRFVLYDVAGADAAAIRAAIDALRPVDPRDPGHSFDAATEWSMRWRWPVDSHGTCDLTRARVSFSATITLPRLVQEVAEPVMAAWNRYIAALERHEAAHARYGYDHRVDVLAAIRQAQCATADAAATRTLAGLTAHERERDSRTRHGATEGITSPE